MQDLRLTGLDENTSVVTSLSLPLSTSSYMFIFFFEVHFFLTLVSPHYLALLVMCDQKGELPDSKSRALQQLAQDFGSQCESIAKSLGKKGGEADAGKAYDKASVILEQYLKGVELDPLGSASYN